MSLFSGLRSQVASWWQDAPLPSDTSDSIPTFQPWHQFDESRQQWVLTTATPPPGQATTSQTSIRDQSMSTQDPLTLVTWNIQATGGQPEARTEAIISHLRGLSSASSAVDVIFFQEVSKKALAVILADPWIRLDWFSSEAPDAASWGGHLFVQMTLLSRARFGHASNEPDAASAATIRLGPVWRVKFPTRFGRDALFCDVHIPVRGAGAASDSTACVRLANVHLDSLPVSPSRRPRQVSVVASYLKTVGRGLVAGDFNPVLPEDDALVRDNGLLDVWTELHPADPRFTWGVDGKQPFPPNRLDKVATVGLKVTEVEVLHPGFVHGPGSDLNHEEAAETAPGIPWSDHSGLRCCFRGV